MQKSSSKLFLKSILRLNLILIMLKKSMSQSLYKKKLYYYEEHSNFNQDFNMCNNRSEPKINITTLKQSEIEESIFYSPFMTIPNNLAGANISLTAYLLETFTDTRYSFEVTAGLPSFLSTDNPGYVYFQHLIHFLSNGKIKYELRTKDKDNTVISSVECDRRLISEIDPSNKIHEIKCILQPIAFSNIPYIYNADINIVFEKVSLYKCDSKAKKIELPELLQNEAKYVKIRTDLLLSIDTQKTFYDEEGNSIMNNEDFFNVPTLISSAVETYFYFFPEAAKKPDFKTIYDAGDSSPMGLILDINAVRCSEGCSYCETTFYKEGQRNLAKCLKCNPGYKLNPEGKCFCNDPRELHFLSLVQRNANLFLPFYPNFPGFICNDRAFSCENLKNLNIDYENLGCILEARKRFTIDNLILKDISIENLGNHESKIILNLDEKEKKISENENCDNHFFFNFAKIITNPSLQRISVSNLFQNLGFYKWNGGKAEIIFNEALPEFTISVLTSGSEEVLASTIVSFKIFVVFSFDQEIQVYDESNPGIYKIDSSTKIFEILSLDYIIYGKNIEKINNDDGDYTRTKKFDAIGLVETSPSCLDCKVTCITNLNPNQEADKPSVNCEIYLDEDTTQPLTGVVVENSTKIYAKLTPFYIPFQLNNKSPLESSCFLIKNSAEQTINCESQETTKLGLKTLIFEFEVKEDSNFTISVNFENEDDSEKQDQFVMNFKIGTFQKFAESEKFFESDSKGIIRILVFVGIGIMSLLSCGITIYLLRRCIYTENAG